MTRKLQSRMICGELHKSIHSVTNKPIEGVRAIRLIDKTNEGWNAVVRTGKQRGRHIVIPESKIIVFKDRM